MDERIADRVIVPDVVGLPFHVGRDVAAESGVALASADPDQPSINALAWPGLFCITAQNPPAGTEVCRWDSVAVEIVGYGEADRGALRTPPVAPPADVAHAKPETTDFVDLTPTENIDQNPL
ncbi:hypothetical protein [Lacisediminihabitans sp.]|uniref:hypothetical protein n=1 Tax=Lacisediminihabitans sp. TaxID=2787631 RepID=UPI00374D3236